MAAPNPPVFHSGSHGRVFVTPTTGTTPTQSELAVSKWDGTFDGDVQEFSNNRDGRWRQPGNEDAKGTATLFWDSGNRVSDIGDTTADKPDLRHGSILDAQFSEDGTSDTVNSWRLRIIINNVKPSSDFSGTISYDVDWALQSGGILYPGDPDPV